MLPLIMDETRDLRFRADINEQVLVALAALLVLGVLGPKHG